MRLPRLAVAAALAFACGASHAADRVTLASAWMRPAPADAPLARAYVDIASTVDGKLVGARTPVAQRVELVGVRTIGDPSTEQVVKSFPLVAGTTTRLAYLGDHLRFTGLKRAVGNGDPVPLTLVFVDRAGHRFEASTEIVVRGLLLPQQVPPESAPATDGTGQRNQRAPHVPGRPATPPPPVESSTPPKM